MENYEKHPLNILPEMSETDKGELRRDLLKNGFNKDFPIFTYQEKILDGWNRFLICEELEIEAVFKSKDDEFSEDDQKAVEFVMQVNTRRNLSSSQKAALAVESADLITRIKTETEKSRRAKQSKTNQDKKDESDAAAAEPDKNGVETNGDLKDAAANADGDRDETRASEHAVGEDSDFPVDDDDDDEEGERDKDDADEHENKSASKLATKFGTNRTYVNDAAKLKTENPSEFEKVKSGEKSLSKAKKDSSAKKDGSAENSSTARTYFQEIAARFAEYAKVLKKLQDYGDSEMVIDHHKLYPQILGVDIKKFEKMNAEIATYLICDECGGAAGCDTCDNEGFIKPVEKEKK